MDAQLVEFGTSKETLRSVVGKMTTEELHSEFRKGLRITVEHLNRLGLILVELESRGEIAVGVEQGLLKLLRNIASGKILAEVVVRFASAPKIMRRVGGLPVEEQQRIVGDDAEVDNLLRPQTRPKASNPLPGFSHVEYANTEKSNPIAAASKASPRALAELIAEMIAVNPNPKDVWAALNREEFIRDLKAGR